jgi:protein involved in polysaccharide export with SLBB domain
MIQGTSRTWALWGLLAAAALPAGCTTGPGNRFVLFPESHRLIESARELRAAGIQTASIPRELDKGLARPFEVEPGDVVLVQPANLDSPVRLPGDQQVLPDGSIQLGRYGRVIVAGKTVERIEAEVNELVHAQTPDAGPISVRLVTRDSKVFYVLGEVNAPGAFQLKGRETVLDAIVAAGGLSSNASRRSIILTRPTKPDACRIVLPVCYNEIVQVGDTSTNYQLSAGDRVYVPSRSFWDDLHPFKHECAPCGRPHSPCLGETCAPPAERPQEPLHLPAPADGLPPHQG